jgi:nucleoside-diphosphate-sugar epimerase
MKLTIMGATGGIGRHLVERAVRDGHSVTAVVRRPDGAPDGVRTVVVPDLADADAAALESATAGADAVLSAVGPRSRDDVGIASAATRAVVAAMGVTGVRRLVVVSAAPVGTVAVPGRPRPPRHDPGDDPLARRVLTPLVRRAFAAQYADLAVMEDVLRAGDLDWTVVRPPRLTGSTGRPYRTAIDRNVSRGRTIGRAEVAALMLGVVDDGRTVRHTVGVAH